MKRAKCGAAVALLFGCAAIVAAQTATGSNPQTTSRDRNETGTITVVGCLQAPGQGSTATGTTGSATSAPAGSFILTNASITSPSNRTGSTSGTTGTGATSSTGAGTSSRTPTGTATSGSGSTAASGAGTSYVLEGNTSDLSRHANHRIEVTGTLAPMSSGTGSTGATGGATTGTRTGGTTTGTGATSSTGAGTTAAQHLRVSSVRMISTDCSASGR